MWKLNSKTGRHIAAFAASVGAAIAAAGFLGVGTATATEGKERISALSVTCKSVTWAVTDFQAAVSADVDPNLPVLDSPEGTIKVDTSTLMSGDRVTLTVSWADGHVESNLATIPNCTQYVHRDGPVSSCAGGTLTGGPVTVQVTGPIDAADNKLGVWATGSAPVAWLTKVAPGTFSGTIKFAPSHLRIRTSGPVSGTVTGGIDCTPPPVEFTVAWKALTCVPGAKNDTNANPDINPAAAGVYNAGTWSNGSRTASVTANDGYTPATGTELTHVYKDDGGNCGAPPTIVIHTDGGALGSAHGGGLALMGLGLIGLIGLGMRGFAAMR